MPPVRAVRTVLGQYAVCAGRARRSEHWWSWHLGVVAKALAASSDAWVVDVPWGQHRLLGVVPVLASVVPSIAVAVRRLHATDRSGWWYLVGPLPIIGGTALLVLYGQDSREPNRFAAPPEVTTAAAWSTSVHDQRASRASRDGRST